ncbi:MAG: UDP-N-acetylglucosamine 1-carboxyvinyltransferase [Lachnospiraceae bacterium]|nr:UDP-N-acetylglucosamine 1-carboxyvinyltransferase [Lachnospiraceae bacterium]
MDAVRIYGGNCLSGQTKIQGSKNASLPILAATLLIDGTCEIVNCPDISDVYHMLRLLESLGCRVCRRADVIRIDTCGVAECDMPADSVGVMRSSIMLLGALLARMGEVAMEYPGGCVIGKRPIDLHLQALRRMGVEITEESEGFCASAWRLHGAVHELPFVSVGVTENLILAAVLAEGETVIHPAAREPEIQALCEFLVSAGARISGAGTDRLVIRGVKKLCPVRFCVPADRIVAGTWLTACLCAGGRVFLEDAPCGQMESVLACAEKLGVRLSQSPEGLLVEGRACKGLKKDLVTAVYPGFPTDLQSLFMAAIAFSGQDGRIVETVFENRFRIVPELLKMGADIRVQGNCACIRGNRPLHNTIVEAKELRGGAALVVAALAAEGTGIVTNRHYIDRGYEDITRSLRDLGAEIELA